MGILREDNDCMLAKDSLIKNNGGKMLLWKQELLPSLQREKKTNISLCRKINIQLHVKRFIAYFIVNS